MSDETSAPDEGMPPAEPAGPEGVMGAPEAPMPPEMPPPPEMPSPDMPQPVEPPPAWAPAPPPPPYAPPPGEPYAPPPAQYAPPPPPPYSAPAEVMPLRPGPASDSSKILAGIGYIFGIIALVMLFVDPYKDEKFVRFHAVQAVAIWAAYIVANVLWVIPVLGWLAYGIAAIALLVFSIIALVKAFQGQYYEVPLVYPVVKGFVGE